MTWTAADIEQLFNPMRQATQSFAEAVGSQLPMLSGGVYNLLAGIDTAAANATAKYYQDIINGETELACTYNMIASMTDGAPVSFAYAPPRLDQAPDEQDCTNDDLDKRLHVSFEQIQTNWVVSGERAPGGYAARVVLEPHLQNAGRFPLFSTAIELNCPWKNTVYKSLSSSTSSRYSYHTVVTYLPTDEQVLTGSPVGRVFLTSAVSKLLPESRYQVDAETLGEAIGDSFHAVQQTFNEGDERQFRVQLYCNASDQAVLCEDHDWPETFTYWSYDGPRIVNPQTLLVRVQYKEDRRYGMMDFELGDKPLPLWIQVLLARHFDLPYLQPKQPMVATFGAVQRFNRHVPKATQHALNQRHFDHPEPGDCWIERVEPYFVVHHVNDDDSVAVSTTTTDDKGQRYLTFDVLETLSRERWTEILKYRHSEDFIADVTPGQYTVEAPPTV